MALSEFDLIDRYFTPAGARDDVLVPIGDDAAVVMPPPGLALATAVDTLVAGVHFPEDAPVGAIGHKALAVNLSDLAAMGSEPAWCLLALTLPAADETWLRAFADGFRRLAERHEVALIGGDTTRGPLTISVTVGGYVDTPMRRGGSVAGDDVWISGTLGEAAAGLQLWLAGERDRPGADRLFERLHRPTPRVALGRALRGVATAAIDVSDGLAADAGHVAAASDVAITLDQRALPLPDVTLPEAERVAFALTGGDDYELLFCAPAEARDAVEQAAAEAGTPVHRIGRAERGSGVWLRGADDRREPIDGGFRHFDGGGGR